MRKALLLTIMIFFCASIAIMTITPADAVGKYTLAFWRDRGLNDTAGCTGFPVIHVWVWDEQGNPKSGVKLYTSWGVYLGSTGHDGRFEMPIDINNKGYDLLCADDNGSLSDIAPTMTGQRQPCWGHYSYQIGFLYKSDASNPGTFDTSLNCTLNTADSYDNDAPYTKSMAFYSTDCTDRTSDPFALGNGQSGSSFFGQTFVANGDRVAGVQLHGTIGGVSRLTYYVQVLQGGPYGSPVSPVITFNDVPMMEFFQPFKPNDCPVVPGQTYFLKVWRPDGMNMYQVTRNNYSQGQAYEGYTAIPGRELRGFIVCMNYGPVRGTLAGTVRDDLNTAIGDALITVSPGDRTTTSAANGTFSLPNMEPGVYSISVARPGYCPATVTGIAVTANQTTAIPVTLPRATNRIQNSTFASSMTNWTVIGTFGINYDGEWAIPAHTAPNWAGKATSWGVAAGTAYQQVSGLTIGQVYDASTFYYTSSYTGSTTYPDNVKCQIGVDPSGGTNPGAGSVQWATPASSHNKWSFMTKSFTATGANATVFLRYTMTDTREWNKAAFDDVYLTTCQSSSVQITAGPTVSNIATNSATISWTTNPAGNSIVEYGPTTSYGLTASDPAVVTNHSVNLTNLQPGTTYNYRVKTQAGGYNDGVSGNATFTTNMPGGTLRNPGFEDGTTQTAWTRYGQFGSGTDTGIQSGNFFEIYPHSGTYFAGSASSWGTKNGGFYQRVTGINPGETWKLTAWVCTYNQGSTAQSVNNRIGIDPNGGTSATSPSIIWSARTSTQYEWKQIAAIAQATSSALTVFLDAQQLNAVQWNLNAFDDCSLTQGTLVNIPQALATADGDEVIFMDKLATAGTYQIGGAFYIEEADRSAGIRIVSNTPVNQGDRVSVAGTMGLNTHGERVVNTGSVSVTQTGQTLPDPLFLLTRNLGGSSPNSYTPGVWNGLGLYNVGLLVTCVGRITATGTGYFYIDDGSSIEDGSGNVGVRVDTTELTNPTQTYAIVTGISTVRTVGGKSVRAIRPRSNDDIVGF